MREGFKEGIFEAARLDPKIHVLTGDHGYGLFDTFRSTFPERFHNVGVAEANLVGVAAGFARNGLRPIIYGLAPFVPNRVFEFIKLQIALDRLPVLIVGDGAGLVYSTLGRSHQTLEDLAIIGALPQVATLSPGSDLEMKTSILWAVQQDSPVYIRIGKSGGVYSEGSQSVGPEPNIVWSEGRDSQAAVIAHGSMVSEIFKAKDLLSEYDLDYWSCPSIFPLDRAFVAFIKQNYEKVFIVEEHSTRGGLASEMILELQGSGTLVHPICAIMQSGYEVGDYDWNLDRHGLSSIKIAERIKPNV